RAGRLAAGLSALSDKWGMRGERGAGLLRALILDRDDGPALVEAARRRAPEGLLLNAPRPDLLRFMPALNVAAADIDAMLAWLDDLVAHPRVCAPSSPGVTPRHVPCAETRYARRASTPVGAFIQGPPWKGTQGMHPSVRTIALATLMGLSSTALATDPIHIAPKLAVADDAGFEPGMLEDCPLQAEFSTYLRNNLGHGNATFTDAPLPTPEGRSLKVELTDFAISGNGFIGHRLYL